MDRITKAIVNLVSSPSAPERPTIPEGPFSFDDTTTTGPTQLRHYDHIHHMRPAYGVPLEVRAMVRNHPKVVKAVKPILKQLAELERINHSLYDSMAGFGQDATRAAHMQKRSENAHQLASGADPASVTHRALRSLERENSERLEAVKLAWKRNTQAMHALLAPVFEVAAAVAEDLAGDQIVFEHQRCLAFGFPAPDRPPETALSLHSLAMTIRARAKQAPDFGGFITDVSLQLVEL